MSAIYDFNRLYSRKGANDNVLTIADFRLQYVLQFRSVFYFKTFLDSHSIVTARHQLHTEDQKKRFRG